MRQNYAFLLVVVLCVTCEVTGKAQLDVSFKTLNLETTAFWKLQPSPEADILYSVKYTKDYGKQWTSPPECQNISNTYCVLGVFDNSRTFSDKVDMMTDWEVCVTAMSGMNIAESCKTTNQKFDGSVTCPTEDDVNIFTFSRKVVIYVQSPKSPYYQKNGAVMRIDDLKLVFSIYVSITIHGNGKIPKYQEYKLPTSKEFTNLVPNSLYNISIKSKYGSGSSYATDDDNTCIFQVQTLEEAPEKPAEIIDYTFNKNNACLSHDVKVYWQEPDKQYQHGKITRYDVHYSSYDHDVIDSGVVTVNGSQNYATLSDLSCWNKYKVILVTWNSVGNISFEGREIGWCDVCNSTIEYSKESIVDEERSFQEVMYFSLFIMIALLLLLASALGLCYRKYPKNEFRPPEWLVSHKYKDMCSNVPFHKDSSPKEVFDQLLSPSDKLKSSAQNTDRPISSAELEPVMITRSDIDEQSTVNKCSYAQINFEMTSRIQEEKNLKIENTSICPAETSESSGMSSFSNDSVEQYVKADLGFPVVGKSNDSGYVTNMPIIATTDYLPLKPIISSGSPVQTPVL